MRYVFGIIGVMAALLFVGYSAIIAYHVAYKMNSEFQAYAGWAAVGMVIWGSIGLLLAYYLRQMTPRHTFLAVACVLLVIAAEIYVTRLDLRFQVGGQSDVTAVRADVNVKSADTKTELDKARARRDTLQGKKALTDAEQDDLVEVKTRVTTLENQWKTMTVNAGGMAEAAWLSRWGKDEEYWETMLMVVGLIFWPLARMFAFPIAFAAMLGVIRTKATAGVTEPRKAEPPVDAQKSETAVLTPLVPVETPVLTKPERMPAGLWSQLTDDQKQAALAWADKPAVSSGVLLGGTTAEPDPDDDKPKPEPTPEQFDDADDSEPERVVTLDGSPYVPSKRDLKRQKREHLISQHAATVERFIDDCLDVTSGKAEIVYNDNGGYLRGGTPARDVHKEYVRFCKESGLPFLHQNKFGEFIRAHIEGAKNSRGAVYACVLPSKKARKMAAAA
jgi:hypothetical protein